MLVKKTLLTAVGVCAFIFALLADNEIDKRLYIEKYKDIAMEHHKAMGIPASIKLAQGLLESQYGQSTLAREANNHFGIKCKSDWDGGSYLKEDDDYNEEGQLIKSCFRSYNTAEASFQDHSIFLKSNRRYAALFTFGNDYKKWARGLQEAGYATAPDYANRLIQIIEDLELYQYDQPMDLVMGGDPKRKKPVMKPGETRKDSWSTARMRKPRPVSKPNLDEWSDENRFEKPQQTTMESVPYNATIALSTAVAEEPMFSSPSIRPVRRR